MSSKITQKRKTQERLLDSVVVLFLLLTTSRLLVNSYVDVYVEGPSIAEDLNIYLYDGSIWLPVHVTYVSESVPTIVMAFNKTVNMLYYNVSRYILYVPARAISSTKRPANPPGFERWELEISNKTSKVTVPLVGRRLIAKPRQRGLD